MNSKSRLFAVMRELMIYSCLLQALAFDCILASNETGSSTNPPDVEVATDDYFDKDESFVNCQKFPLDPDEFVIYSNGTAYVHDYKRYYGKQFYHLEENTTLYVCVPDEDDLERHDPTHTLNSDALHHLTAVGIGVSMVCLFVHLVVFAVVPDMQNLPGCNMAALCVSLFFSYTLMIVALQDSVHQDRAACVSSAGLMQFFLMASFLWMFVIAFDVFRSIRQATSNLRAAPKGFNVRRFVCNNLIAWGTSLVLTAAAMIVDNVEGVPEQYQPQFEVMCWFNQKQSLLIFFSGPVCVLIIVNFILFGVSAYKIFMNRMKSNPDSHQTNLKRSHVMYFRLGIIMGVTWITGTLAPLVNVLWLWFFFAALNAFQGFFIFIAFTCVGKVRKYFKVKFFGEKTPKKSLTPTVMTYGTSNKSSEKDLDEKTVTSKDKSAVMEAGM